MKAKKIILIILAIAIVIGIGIVMGVGEKNKNNSNNSNIRYNVVASNFASYDFLRAIIGDNKEIELTFLIGPGKDAHSYDPTAQDLITIKNANLFVYIGGEMEQWADKVLESIEANKTKKICISDFVDTIEEKK